MLEIVEALLVELGGRGLGRRVTPHDSLDRDLGIGSLERVALVQYTSGSTGQPTRVLLSHANLLANIRAIGEAIAIGPEDVAASWLPLHHDMGLIGARR